MTKSKLELSSYWFYLRITRELYQILQNKKLTAVPIKTFSAFPDWREASVSAQKLHWTGKETCWSASSPYFFPGMNTETVPLSRTEEHSKH